MEIESNLGELEILIVCQPYLTLYYLNNAEKPSQEIKIKIQTPVA